MAWPKGKPRGARPPGAGRKRGTPNKVTKDVAAWARSVLEDPDVRRKTLSSAKQGRLAPAIVIELMHYGYGKPKDTLALEVPRPLVVDLLTRRGSDDSA